MSAVLDTSAIAYREHKEAGHLTRQQRKVMYAVYDAPASRDWSLQELSQVTGIAVHVISARVNELIEEKYLYRTEKTRPCTITRKSVHPVMLPPRQLSLI